MVSLMNKPIIEVGTQRYYVSKYVSAVHIITTVEAVYDIILHTVKSLLVAVPSDSLVDLVPALK